MNSENNFYLINKPTWISSFDVIRQMRKKLNIKKMGHTGTLDPLATGLMLIATWNYTKLIPYFEKNTKTYIAEISLDGFSPSFDSETKISFLKKERIKFFKENLKIEKIENIIKKNFSWEILQTPPSYSALKIWWKKACDLVREWKEVKMKQRKATIFDYKILNYNYPIFEIWLKVSAWTYIRSIANELWNFLWTWGYLTFLKRINIWKLDIEDSIIMEFEDLSPIDIKKILPEKNFIDISFFSEKELKKIDNWLEFFYNNSDLEKGELFLFDWGKIVNIILYDLQKIIPKRKI